MKPIDALIFLPAPPESSLLYVGIYDPWLVMLSVLIAILASLAALLVADRIRLAESRGTHLGWLGLGALAMGMGIWAMHFIGMLALSLPCGVNYDLLITVASMLPGALASAVAIEVLRKAKPSQRRLLVGSVLLGAGVGTMHYTGMAAMRIDGLLRYNPQLFLWSIAVAVMLAFVALQVRYRIGNRRWRLAMAATVMGCAVSGMHYTAMAATYFIRADDVSIPISALNPNLLAVLVSVVTGLLVALVLAATVAARHQENLQRLGASEFRLRSILETTQEGFLQIDTANVLHEVNPAFCAIVDRSHADLIGTALADLMTSEGAGIFQAEMLKRAAGLSSSYEVALIRPDGSLRHCHFNGTPIFDSEGERVGSFALVSDITERIAHEAYERQAVAIIEFTAEGVMLTDRNERILSINPAFTRITGYSEQEVLGLSPALLKSGRHEEYFYQQMWAEILDSDHWQGEIWNRKKNGEIFPEWLTISAVRDGNGELKNYIGVFSDISHIKRSAAELERLAHYDPLTNLANRQLLDAQLRHALDRAQRYQELLVVMALDLDGFKNVNDTLGHPAGDRLLQIIAQRLKDVLRAEDIIARMGGDEFVVVLESVESVDDVSHVAEKILAACAEPLDLEGQVARVTCSIGIALFPNDGQDAIALIKAADTSMYVSKRGGRNTYRFYAAEMTSSVRKRHEVEQGLRNAIDRNELELWYQPQIALKSKRVVGVEALVRWRHPERGLVPPGDFLPVASDTGLIVPLGEWVLRTACRQAKTWHEAGLGLEHVAVNVDGQQIVRTDFVETVENVLAETGLSPHHLELEITEGFLLENAERGMGTVMRFSDMGVDVAIDDFGTGYSSLAYLKYLHADCMKIDKSFVDDLPNDSISAAIIQAITGLGHGLGFTIVAEGVETHEQLVYLRNVNCDLVQGYYFAKPMPPAEFEAWLRADTIAALLAT